MPAYRPPPSSRRDIADLQLDTFGSPEWSERPSVSRRMVTSPHSLKFSPTPLDRPTFSSQQQAQPPFFTQLQQPLEFQSRNTSEVAEPPRCTPSETALLRDLPFNLQGVTSNHLHFIPTGLKLPKTLPIPLISLLNTLAEPCLLYRDLASFVENTNGGLIDQGLRSAVGEELRSYLGLVALLEGEIRTALSALSQSREFLDDGTHAEAKARVTLRKCVVWMRDATMALRLMSVIVEQTRGKKGGQIISLIHGFSSSHGDPFVCTFAERLLVHVARPFYGMLTSWIYDGELSDPYREFFAVEPDHRPATDPRRIATSVWDDKYKLDRDMVPTIMSEEFAQKVFLIGKSLNFIRYGCGDSAWVASYSKDASKELTYGDTATLETSIDEAYKTTTARLIYLMSTRFKLFEHLRALKKYLLLGQGDFIGLLMESLASNLDRPANSQYRHTLTAQLENAIRSSNAQFDSPDVLRRLDARMLELSHGESGWDCFTLEYMVDAPVDVIITPWGSTQYLKVFNFLWRVRRVEFALNSIWRRCITGARGVLGAVEDKLGQDWKRARCVIAEMNHFIAQLQYYILFEVIESSWDQLQIEMNRPGCTLDDLIEAHAKYLNAITHKGLLGGSSRSASMQSATGEPFLSQLHHLLKIMLAYKDALDGLYSFSVAEYTRRQELKAKIETRTAQGGWGVTEKDLLSTQGRHRASTLASTDATTAPDTASASTSSFHRPRRSLSISEASNIHAASLVHDASVNTATDPSFNMDSGEGHMLSALRTRLGDLSREFRTRMITLLTDLAYQPDVDMRFLGLVMNFNDVYKIRRRRRDANGSSTGGSKDKKRAATADAKQ